jgi:putative membrane protein
MVMRKFFSAVANFVYSHAVTFLKGLAIGLSVIVPGVSGGTMAILLGIYQRLLRAVNTFFKNFKESILFLSVLAAGALVSIFAASNLIGYLLENYKSVTNFFFLGIILGGLPVIYKESDLDYGTLIRLENGGGYKARRILRDALPFVIGAGLVVGIGFIKTALIDLSAVEGFWSVVFNVLIGFIAAVALVLPGISGSYFLMALGLYEKYNYAISNLVVLDLIPFAVGAVAGIVLTAKVLDRLLQTRKRGTYLLILGFLIGSLAQLFLENIPAGMDILYCCLTLLAGIAVIVSVTRLARKYGGKEKESGQT